MVRYEDDSLSLQHTDMTHLAHKAAAASAAGASAALPPLPEPEGVDAGGSKCALVVSFTLPSSTYATMCLRELLKVRESEVAASESEGEFV